MSKGMDQYYEWENMSISSIIWLMIKWFNFDDVQMNTSYRKDVESGVWISISIERKKERWFIDGQRPDIVKRRLIEFLDRQNIRGEFLKERGKKLLE